VKVNDAALAGLLATVAVAGATAVKDHTPDAAIVTRTDPSDAGDVRHGQVAGVAIAVGIGGAVALVIGDHRPLLVAVAAAVAAALVYEWLLHRDVKTGVPDQWRG